LTSEYNAIAGYNQALIGWEYVKGTIMQHDNVMIADGPLPGCVQGRAVEHQRERTKAIVLRERAAPIAHESFHLDGEASKEVLPVLPSTGAPSLTALMQNTPPVPPTPEMPGGTPFGKPVEPNRLSLDSAKKPEFKDGLPPAPLGNSGFEMKKN